MSNRVLAHWAESCNGGGERVGWELARAFDLPLHVGSRDPSIEPDDVCVRELWSDGLARRLIDRGGLAKMAAYAHCWQDVPAFDDADTLVTSGLEPLFYVPDGEQTWIAYTHHTGRQQTDLLSDRWRDAGLRGHIARLVMWGQRLVMDSNATKPDRFVANSEPVARRITRYWGVPEHKISVVYPPVPVASFSRDHALTQDYYLTLSRLDWHKQLGAVVDAFQDVDARLVVAGDGQERDQLEARAPENVEFIGYVSEDRKRELYAGAKAVITNALAEDFGLTTVEPLAAGTPVLGVAEGMTQHLISDGETGIVYDRGELRDAVGRFEREGVAFTPAEIEAVADRFSVPRFHEAIRAVVAETEQATAAAHAPDWEVRRDRLAADGGEP